MKKLYTTLLLALMAMTASAQAQNDTVYVMFDFNLNPWNYPTSSKSAKGWGPNYDDETGAIYKETSFPWAIAEGSDKQINVIVYPIDTDEYERPAVLMRGENYDVKTADELNDSVMTMLFTNPGTQMRFLAPEGYKFGKMVFYDYRSSYYVLETEEVVRAYRFGAWHDDTHKIWIPTTPKQDQYGTDCWAGDETNILFNQIANFKGNFMKIDMRLVPDGTNGITELKASNKAPRIVSLDGTVVCPGSLRSGIYIIDGKKHVVR